MSTVGNNILKSNLLKTSDLNLSKNLHPSIQDLQSHLLNLWTTSAVDETYQNLFLVFIQSFSHPKDQGREIEAEIKKTYQKNSLYFLLQENLSLRAEIKSQIQDQITKQTQSGNVKKSNKVDMILRQICDKLKNLRRINLLISQNILKIFEDFKITRQNSIGSLGRNYIDVFMKIDMQNEFIKESFLNEYILFQKGYDPFFLVHYEQTKKSQNLYNLKKHAPVCELFEMNISYVYRLMRAQQKMLKYMLFIDDHSGVEKERKELINRQRLLKIANSNLSNLPEERQEDELHLPPINSKSLEKSRLQGNASIASTIKQFMPALSRKPKIMREGEQVNNYSDLSEGVRKKIHSLKPIESQKIHQSLNSNTPKHYSIKESIIPMKSPHFNGKFQSRNPVNYDTEDDIQNNGLSQRERDEIRASREQSQISATNSQKKWNIKQVRKDRMHNMRPVRTQEYNNGHIIDEEEQHNNEFINRNRPYYQNDYPVYISLKKSKLADSQVQEISRSRYRIKRQKSRQGKRSKSRERERETSSEKYKKKDKQSKKKKHKNAKDRSDSSEEDDSRRNQKTKKKKDKHKKKKDDSSQTEEQVNHKSKKKTKKKSKRISTQSQIQSQESRSKSEYQSQQESQDQVKSSPEESQSISSQEKKKKNKHKKQKEKQQKEKEKENKEKSKKKQPESEQSEEQQLPIKKNSNPTKEKQKQPEKKSKEQQSAKIQSQPKVTAEPKESQSQSESESEQQIAQTNKTQQKLVSEKQPQVAKNKASEESPKKNTIPTKNAQKTEKSQLPPKQIKQEKPVSKTAQKSVQKLNEKPIQKPVQQKKQEIQQKKQPPKKQTPKIEPVIKKQQPLVKKEEPSKKIETQKKVDAPKTVQQSKNVEPPKKVEPPNKVEPQKKTQTPNKVETTKKVQPIQPQKPVVPPPVKKKESESESQSEDQSEEESSEQAPEIKPKPSTQSQITPASKIKMIPGKVTYAQFQTYIKSKKAHPSYSQKLEENIKFVFASAKNTQTYLNEFHLNDQLAAVALCSPTASGNIVIYLWMPIQKACDEKSSQFFFKKYLDYIEQQTTCKAIVYSGTEIPELKSQGFVLQKEKNYMRKRVKAVTKEEFQLEYFFSMEASNICFIQNTAESLFFSDQISPLTEQNSWCNPDLLNAKEEEIDQELDDDWDVQENIKSLKQVNAILEKDEYDTFEIGQEKIAFKDINMTRCQLQQVPKLGFISNDGFMIVAAKSILFTDPKRKIDKFELMNDVCLYFGSNFKNVQEMAKFLIQVKDKAKQQDCKIAFKMFSKQVYGRYVVKDSELSKDKAFYCNWDLNFAWRDEIPGKIIHDMTGVKNKYGPQNFICAVEEKGILTLGIEVEKDDFLY